MPIALQVLATAQALEKAAQRTFKPLGLTPAQFNVLNLLAAQPAGVRASDLARALIVDRSNVTGLLKRMKKDGLLREVPTAHDRRQRVVALSPKGRASWGAANPAFEKGLVACDAAIGAADRKLAVQMLQRLAAIAAALP